MKKIILISALSAFMVVACKKDRTCTCTSTPVIYTVNGQTQTLAQPSTNVTKYTKVKKDEADCNSGEETTKTSAVFGGTVFAIVETTKKDCKLE